MKLFTVALYSKWEQQGRERDYMYVSDQLHSPAYLRLGKETLVPTDKEAAWAPTAGLNAIAKRKLSCHLRQSNADFSVVQYVH
jgi:hypothetical protein